MEKNSTNFNPFVWYFSYRSKLEDANKKLFKDDNSCICSLYEGKYYSYKITDYFWAQNIYFRCLADYNINQLLGYAEQLPPEKLDHIKHLINVLKIFHSDTIEEAEEMLDILHITKENIQHISDYIPFNKKQFNRFITEFNFESKSLDNFILQASCIITHAGYRIDDNSKYFGEILRDYIKILSKSKLDRNNKYVCIWKINNNIKKWFKKLGLNEYTKLITSLKKELSIEISSLSWDNVRFCEGYINLYHPAHPFKPFKINDARSKKKFQDLKKYFSSRYKKPIILSVNGFIKDVLNQERLDNSIDFLTNIYQTDQNTDNHQHKSSPYQISPNEVDRYLRQKKSIFIRWLCKHHIASYKIALIREIKSNSDLQVIDEDAFLFTIYESSTDVILAYENTEELKSTILFIVPKEKRDQSILDIHHYFSSDEINKRLKIAQKRSTADIFKNFKHLRIMHTDFKSWEENIKTFCQLIYP